MKKINLYVGNTVRLSSIPHHFIPTLRRELIIENPKWLENEKHKRFNGKTPPKLRFVSDDSMTVPRGFLRQLKKMLKKAKIPYVIKYRSESVPIEIESKINLLKHQEKALDKTIKRRAGVLEAPTGSGKTVMAIETICRRKERALIVVHTKELMLQWMERLVEHTNLTKDDIGLLGDGKKKAGKVTVGIINTLRTSVKKNPNYFKGSFGFVIVDECHRIPSSTFTEFLVKLSTKYMLGLSATPYRRDGLDLVIKFFMGDIIHKIETKKLQKGGHILKAKLKMITTRFSPYIDGTKSYQKVIKELVKDEGRNNLINHYVNLQAMKKDGGAILIVSDRKEHCQTLLDNLSPNHSSAMLTGTVPPKKRKEVMESVNNKEINILVATGQLVGEGLDIRHLSAIFLTTPIKYEGRLVQYIGRILRTCDGKDEAIIYDFSDPAWILRGAYNNRIKAYRSMGILK